MHVREERGREGKGGEWEGEGEGGEERKREAESERASLLVHMCLCEEAKGGAQVSCCAVFP